MDSASYSIFYEAFKDEHPAWALVACAVSLAIIAVAGMILNLGVILVTFRSKQLKNTANYLLALTSLFEILHQHGHFLFVYTALSGKNFIEYQLAMKLSLVCMFGLGGIGVSMLLIGLDRLICILYPQFPKMVKLGPYIFVCALICSVFGFILVFFIIKASYEVPAEGFLITGCIVDILQNEATVFYANSTLLTNICTIFVYIVVGVVIRLRSVSNSSTADQTNRRIFRSLLIIISFNVGGYFANTFYIALIVPHIHSPITIWFLQVILGIFLNISAASNAPILYMTSKDYRKAFREELLRPMFGLCQLKQTQQTATVQPNLSGNRMLQQQQQLQETSRNTSER